MCVCVCVRARACVFLCVKSPDEPSFLYSTADTTPVPWVSPTTSPSPEWTPPSNLTRTASRPPCPIVTTRTTPTRTAPSPAGEGSMVRRWEAGLSGREGDTEVLWYVCGRRVSLGGRETLRYYGTSVVRLWEAGLSGREGDTEVLWYVCGRRVSLGGRETLRYYGTSVGGGSLWESVRRVHLWEPGLFEREGDRQGVSLGGRETCTIVRRWEVGLSGSQ